MLKDFPIILDGLEIPKPTQWDETSNVIETTSQTEAGTDMSIVVRTDKLSVSAGFTCRSRWAQRFAVMRDKDSVVLQEYDIKVGGYKSRKVRIRDFSSSRLSNSEKVENTDGVYSISFTLEEF